MKWEDITLEDISSNIQTGPFGSQLHQSDYAEEGTPVVMPKNLIDGHISEISIARVKQAHVNRLQQHKIQSGDLLFSRRGDVGRCAFATEKEENWLCGTGCLRVTLDQHKANPKFVFYQLQLPQAVEWFAKHAIGSTMLNLNTNILSQSPIKIPSLQIQTRIADILSAYDDLIENNQKQIVLLEEAAQRLYKEWFVDLRFPGHEKTPIVDGVPEGWTKGILSDIAKFARGKIITKEKTKKGNIPVIAGGIEPAYYHNEANTIAPVITISASGANAGFTRMYYVDVFASDCSFVDSISTDYLYYVYCFLKANRMQIDALQKGSAQPHVYPKDINNLVLMIPNDATVSCFCSYTQPYFSLIGKLEKRMQTAKEARDRLLPKLMSGEIEV